MTTRDDDVRVRPGRGGSLHDADALAARLAKLPDVVEATPVLGAAQLERRFRVLPLRSALGGTEDGVTV